MAITFHAETAWSATTLESLTITLPTHSTGDMLIIRIGGKVYNNTFSLNQGWTAVGARVESGTLAGGAGSGSTGAQAWYKIAASGSETAPTLTVGGAANSTPTMYCAISYSKGAGETWVTPSGDGGIDNSNNTSISITINSHVSVLGGDMVDFFYVTHDNDVDTVPTITQTGVTYDTVVEMPAAALSTTVGNDGSADGGYRLATSGTSSAAAVVTGTMDQSEIDSSGWMTRLRVDSAVQGSFTANAVIFSTLSQTFNADANITVTRLTPRPNITALGIWRALRRGYPQKLRGGPLTLPVTEVAGAFTADASILRTTTGVFTADAVVPGGAVTYEFSFTANAVIRRTQSGTFTANATVLRTQSSSFTADAVIKDTCGIYVVGSAFAAATSVALPSFQVGDIAFAQGYSTAGTTPANPSGWTSQYSGSGQRVSSRVLQAGDTTAGTFTSATHVQVIVFRGVRGNVISTFYNSQTAANTTVVYNASQVAGGPLRAHSWILGFAGTKASNANTIGVSGMVTRSGSIGALGLHTKEDTSTWSTGTYASAINVSGWTTATFAFDPELCFTANAVIADAKGSFTANAVVLRTQSGSFTADATIRKYFFTVDAVIKATQSGTFTENAAIRRARTGSFKADAHLGLYRSGSFTADASIFSTAWGTNAFKADAVIYNPALPSQSNPGGGSVGSVDPGGYDIVIRYDGDDITSRVLLRDAVFITKTNGAVGQAKLFVRDDAHTDIFTTGKELTVDIDDFRAWGGYVVRAKKTFFFPVQDTTNDQEVVRGWELEGVDYNVLFQKRVVFRPTDPTNVTFRYSVDTYDDTIIKDIASRFVDLSGLGISFDGVERVDKPIFDIPGNHHRGAVASAGDTWGQTMRAVARATGAVFYISPTKVLTYTDVDTTGPWTLNDQPSGTWDVPYRELDITYNGTSLINDMMVWGAALGSDLIVFKRTEDAASIADHDRWQQGLFSQALYRQSSANRIANSYVYGSPLNKRGGKDDQISFNCTTFFPRFYAGMKIHCVSAVYDFDDVVPLRTAELSFPSKPDDPNTGYPQLKLNISHEIDEPWSTAEFLWRDWPPYHIHIPIIDICIDCIGQVSPECDCGIDGSLCSLDNFNRTLSLGWGISTEGAAWIADPGQEAGFSIDGSSGVFSPEDSVSDGLMSLKGVVPTDVPVTITTRFKLDDTTTDGTYNGEPQFYVTNQSLSFDIVGIDVFVDTDFNNFFIFASGRGTDEPGDIDFIEFYPPDYVWGTWLNLTMLITKGRVQAKIWPDSDTEPVDWMVEAGDSTYSSFVAPMDTFEFVYPNVGQTVSIDYFGLDYDGKPCPGCATQVIDTFTRTTGPDDWGTADTGQTWSVSDSSITPTSIVEVDGSVGRLTVPHPTSFNTNADETSVTLAGTARYDFSCTYKMRVTSQDLVITDITPFFSFDFGGAEWSLETGGVVDANTGQNLEIVAFGASPNSAHDQPFTLTTNTWYQVRWENQYGVSTRLRIWFDGETEPSTWDLELDATGQSFTPQDFTLFVEQGGSTISDLGVDFGVEVDDLQIGDCLEGPGGIVSAGYVCEAPTTTDNRHFQLAAALVSGSSQVFVEGERMVRPTQYTEDSTGGQIIFASTLSIPQADSVYVCYTANGSL